MSETNSRMERQMRKREKDNFSFIVKNARMFADGNTVFNLTIGRVTIYGCMIVDGKDGEFVSFPARKGKDGKYYNHAYCALSPEETAEVVNAVYEALDNA